LRAGFDCDVTAGFLESGRTVANVANAAAIVAGVGYWYEGPGASAVGLAVSLVFWAVESWFAVRVAIDRSLFHTLAEEPGEGADWLDALLVDWKMVKSPKSRSMADRSRGALRLWRMQWVALGLQLTALGCAMILRAVNL
jgi:hypothetical protein